VEYIYQEKKDFPSGKKEMEGSSLKEIYPGNLHKKKKRTAEMFCGGEDPDTTEGTGEFLTQEKKKKGPRWFTEREGEFLCPKNFGV